MVKNLPAMWKTRVQSLGWEDPLEEGMATHSSILAWRIPWIEESGGLQPMGSQRVRHDSTTDTDVYMPIYRLFQFVVIHTVKGFGIVNKTEIDVFLELVLFQ